MSNIEENLVSMIFLRIISYEITEIENSTHYEFFNSLSNYLKRNSVPINSRRELLKIKEAKNELDEKISDSIPKKRFLNDMQKTEEFILDLNLSGEVIGLGIETIPSILDFYSKERQEDQKILDSEFELLRT